MREIKILIVEDNEGDIILAQEAFKEMKMKNSLTLARDGEMAIELINNSELPDIIFLDINLPKVDGKEVLSYIKSNERLKHIPVLIFTTSTSKNDILDAYKGHANCYISKPNNLYRFQEIVRSVEQFWIDTVELPSQLSL